MRSRALLRVLLAGALVVGCGAALRALVASNGGTARTDVAGHVQVRSDVAEAPLPGAAATIRTTVGADHDSRRDVVAIAAFVAALVLAAGWWMRRPRVTRRSRPLILTLVLSRAPPVVLLSVHS